MDGMHELFHGLHGNQLRRKRNPLKQPDRDRAQRRDAPLDRLSKDLHSMLHGTHDSPASLEPEKQDVLGRLSAGMHGMLHGAHQKPAHRRSVSLRAARSPDRHPPGNNTNPNDHTSPPRRALGVHVTIGPQQGTSGAGSA